MGRSRLAGALGIAAIAGLVAATPLAGADGGWQEPIAISTPGQFLFEVNAAMNAGGDALVAWDRREAGRNVVEFTTRIGGRFAVPVVLATDAAGPRVAVSDAGEGVAFWWQSCVGDPDGSVLRAAVRPRGGAFGAPVTLSDGAGASSVDADLRMDAAGNATALWADGEGWIRTAFRPAAGEFGPTLKIASLTGDTQGPWALQQRMDFAVGGDGQAVVAWSGADGVERVAVRGADGAFGPHQTLVSGGVAERGFTPAVAMNDRGDAVVVWRTQLPDGRSLLRAAVRPAGGAFGEAETLAESTTHPVIPVPYKVAIGADGGVTVVWKQVHPDFAAMWFGYRLMTATRPWGGGFGAPETVAMIEGQMGGSQPVDRSFGIDDHEADGTVVALHGRPSRMWRRAPGAAVWEPLETLTPDTWAGEPTLATAPAGALMVWGRRTADESMTIVATATGDPQSGPDWAAPVTDAAPGPALPPPCPAPIEQPNAPEPSPSPAPSATGDGSGAAPSDAPAVEPTSAPTPTRVAVAAITGTPSTVTVRGRLVAGPGGRVVARWRERGTTRRKVVHTGLSRARPRFQVKLRLPSHRRAGTVSVELQAAGTARVVARRAVAGR